MIEFGIFHLGNFFIGLEFVFLSAFVITAAIYDIQLRRIPNWLVLSGIASSLLWATASGYGYGLIFWAAGLAVGFFSFLPLYIFRAMGAGDVKLMALVGSFLGGFAAFQTVVLTLLAGGALALMVMAFKRSWKLVFSNLSVMMANIAIAAMCRQLPKTEMPAQSAGNLPYGVAIAAGTLVYVGFFRQ
ncbi:A24 family peptidase [Noviherbaspirillum soli]|uniref:A24 family peptidase n=1 Tax=Noviherbaspirillum soli TaxID=1064518 RepID=UPI00188A5306|nr:prepilin peptidase [Noviherbaspirillum soli]